MKCLILHIILVFIHCDEIDNNEIISRQQLNLFQQITGTNTSEAQAVWQQVEQEISSVRKRRSTNVLPKFRLQLTDVRSVDDFSVS